MVEPEGLGSEGVRPCPATVGLPRPSPTVALGVGPVELLCDGPTVSTHLAELAEKVWLVEVVLGVGYVEGG